MEVPMMYCGLTGVNHIVASSNAEDAIMMCDLSGYDPDNIRKRVELDKETNVCVVCKLRV